MKKQLSIIALLLVLLLCLAAPALAAPQLDYVTDDAGILTDEEYTQINDYAATLSEYYGCGVYLVILDDYHDFGENPADACDALYEDFQLGYGSDRDAFLLLMSMSERDWWLRSYGEFGTKALNTRGGNAMSEEFLPPFGDNQWFDGFAAYYNEAHRFLEAAANGKPLYSNSSLYLHTMVLAVIPALLVAFITCTVLKRRMKTAVRQTTAAEYITPGGVDITSRSDRYTHTTTTRTKIEHESSSSGSSGGGGGGGGCSTGGKF